MTIKTKPSRHRQVYILLKEHHTNMKFELKTIWILLLLFFPLCVNALGVRDIEIFSALNQPLKAKIALVSVKGLDSQDIRVRLATSEKFKKAGIGRPYFLTRLRFEPIINADGSGHIQVKSRDIIREPYLNFLLEISWRGGSIIKEYVVLLDPVTMRQATVTPQKKTSKQETAEPAAEKKQIYGPVKKAETLWVIAKRTRPSRSIPIKQMIMAIHRDNPNAFVRGNVNLLKQGAHLTIPDTRAINSLTSGSARRQYQEQDQAWKEQQPTTVVTEESEPVERAADVAEEELPTKVIKSDAAVIPAPAEEQPTPAKEQEADDSNESKPAVEAIEPGVDAKLQVVATPEGQLEEILQPQDDIAYPKGDIDQLHESISDAKQDVTALGAINQDLVKLRTALQAKIALVQEELDKTNQAITIVSREMNTSEPTTDSSTADEPETDLTAEPAPTSGLEATPEPEATPESMPAKVEPETPLSDATEIAQPAAPEPPIKEAVEISPEVISKINQPDVGEPSGAEVKTDLAEIARIKKLEGEIDALKSQGQMLQLVKYLVIALAIAFLAAFFLIIGNNRKNRPTDKEQPQKPYLGKSKQSSYSSEMPTITAVRTETSEERASNMRQEMPFNATHNDPDETISQAEHPATLLSHYEALTAGEPRPDTEMLDDDLPTPNTLLFESSHKEADHNEADQDIDSILTTVDVYLAYRRFTEAESILHNSIYRHPELIKLKAKLLEVYAFKKDTKLFARHLERYQDELASEAPELWEDILSIAKPLILDHPSVADIHNNHTDEEPSSDSGADTSHDASEINLGPETLVDELIIGDVQISEDEPFKIDQDEQDPFDIDLDMDMDMDEFNKGK